jgi:hypothetical protein
VEVGRSAIGFFFIDVCVYRLAIMPINFKCPECEKSYSISEKLAGSRFRCKECEELFSVPKSADEEATKSRKRSRPRDDDDEEDDVEDRRSSRSRSRSEVDDDDRPSSRSRRREEEDDERPQRRRAANRDDDDDDYRPKRTSSRRSRDEERAGASSGNGKVILLASICGIAFLAVVGFGIYYLTPNGNKNVVAIDKNNRPANNNPPIVNANDDDPFKAEFEAIKKKAEEEWNKIPVQNPPAKRNNPRMPAGPGGANVATKAWKLDVDAPAESPFKAGEWTTPCSNVDKFFTADYESRFVAVGYHGFNGSGYACYDVENGQKVGDFGDLSGFDKHMHLSRDGKKLASTFFNEVKIKTDDGKLISHPSWKNTEWMLFMPNSDQLVVSTTSGLNHRICLYDINGKEVRQFERELDDFMASGTGAISPKGKHLIVREKGRISAFDLETGKYLCSHNGPSGLKCKAVSFFPDGTKLLVVWEQSGRVLRVQYLNVANGKVEAEFSANYIPFHEHVSISTDGRFVGIFGSWHNDTGESVRRGDFDGLDFGQRGSLMVAGEGFIRLTGNLGSTVLRCSNLK